MDVPGNNVAYYIAVLEQTTEYVDSAEFSVKLRKYVIANNLDYGTFINKVTIVFRVLLENSMIRSDEFTVAGKRMMKYINTSGGTRLLKILKQ